MITLDSYRGTSVAYHKGILCGQSINGRELYDEAQQYYGSSNLAVFRVPRRTESLENLLREALGQY